MNHQDAFRKLIVYIGTIFSTITTAKDALRYLEQIENKEIVFAKKKVESYFREMLIARIIIEVYSLFDSKKGAISLRNVLKDNKGVILNLVENQFKTQLETVISQYSVLIKRLKNNRDKRFAHKQRVDELGWDAVTADALKKMHQVGILRSLKRTESVSDEMILMTLGNFPSAEIKKMLDEVRALTFHQLLKPTLENRASQPK